MTVKTKKNRFIIFLLMLYTFVVLYTPNFSSNPYINYMLPFIYMIIGLIFLKSPEKNRKIRGIFYFVAILIAFWILAAIFFMIRALIAGVELTDIINLRIVQTANIIATIISVCKIERQLTYWNYNLRDKMIFLLNVTMIQAAIVILMLLSSNLRTILLQHFYQYGNGNEFTMANRVYGIMLNYTFSGAIFHGFIASIALTFGVIYDKKIYLYIPFLILMIVLNGRTGMLIFIMGVIINIGYLVIRSKYFTKIISAVIILSVVVSIALLVIKSIKPATYRFLISGIGDVFDYVINNEEDGNVEILLGNFENNINTRTFMLGNGYKIQNSGDIPDGIQFKGEYSDMGYLNDMYMGGIVYMLLLYIPLLYFILANAKEVEFSYDEKTINKIVNIISILMIFICNIKGEVFRSGILIAGVILVKAMIQDKKGDKIDEKSICNNVDL